MTSEQVEQLRCWLPELVAARLTLGSVAIVRVKCLFWGSCFWAKNYWMPDPNSSWLCDGIAVEDGVVFVWWLSFSSAHDWSMYGVETAEGLSVARWQE